MVDTTHYEEHLRRDVETLRKRLRRMADLVLKQLENAVASFADGDRKLAYRVVLWDHQIDVIEQHIDRLCQEFLIRHMPVAAQLRFVMAVAKVNSELERIGDYAEAIARRSVTLSDAKEIPERERIVEMSRLSFHMLRQAVQSFLTDDDELALQTLDTDSQVDRLNSDLFSALADVESVEPDLTMRFALVGLINRIERVADRACNIAEETVYVVRGQVLRHRPREDLRVLFLCDHNRCRSQMAEGIARHLAPAHVIFSSAGTEPRELDRKTVEFLASKGIDISRHRSKSINDVGDIEDFHVVVTLSHGAEEACPPVPYQAVALNWEISDPSKVTGSPEEIEAAYQAAYDKLCARINDMVEGLVGAFEPGDEE